MSDTRPITALDPDSVIEANIVEARENNEYERTLTVEAPGGPPPIRATEVPRDDEFRGADVTPVGYLRDADRRRELEDEVAFGPYVGPVDGEGVDAEEGRRLAREAALGGSRDEDGNLIFDPGPVPGENRRDDLPGRRDEDGNLIADHDGDGIAAADEGPIREAIGAGPSPEEDIADQHGGRSLEDEPRDLDAEADEEVAPVHDPDASEEEQIAGRGLDERDLGESELLNQPAEHSEFLEDAEVSPEAVAAPRQVVGTQPAEDAPAGEWRTWAEANGVDVPSTANKAVTKSALREAGLIQ